MRALLLVLFVSVFVCGCMPLPPMYPEGPAPGDALEIISFDPPMPARLGFGARLNVEIRYEMHSVDGVRIFARPYTGGKKTPGYGAHGSELYPRGDGVIVGWFTFKKAAHVDEVRVEMVNAANNQVIHRIAHEIDATWGAVLIKPVVGPVIKPVKPIVKPIGN